MKFCPVCGSTDMTYSVLGTTAQAYYCKSCSYRGSVIVEDGELSAKLEHEWTQGKVRDQME